MATYRCPQEIFDLVKTGRHGEAWPLLVDWAVETEKKTKPGDILVVPNGKGEDWLFEKKGA
ncbi:MAG: hypothetical protein E6R03_12900 [Hyphomicrobiaceae bacterium]|nr:MAG: hypothetical protein E6R03_12900 [Hyphomicrobiaceae bacterium]